jgi:hypothetical protein
MMAPMIVACALLAARAGAQDQEPEKGPPRAPAGYSIVESDLAGSYFVARPLKDRYDDLVKRVGELRAEIDDARIDEAGARRQIDRLQAEIDEAIRAIDRAKLYVPAARVQHRAATRTIPIGPDDLLLVDAEDVELRGGDGAEVQCVVKKTVLGEIEGEKDLAAEFNGIDVVVRRSSGREMFGFYRTAADRPDLRHEHERFPFKPFLDREFTVVSIKGLTHGEGNRQIRLESKSEGGDGVVSSDWRRHAKLILTVPKCRGVGVQGALRGFRAHSLRSPLMVQGGGNRDYHAQYVVSDLDGAFTASDIPIHRIDGVRGDVSILATAHAEDVGTTHGPDGVTKRPLARGEASYREIRGDLQARFCRTDLTLDGIAGRVDVENAFGKTAWRSDRPVAAMDHRIVSQSGPIEVRFSPAAAGPLPLALATECGTIRLPQGKGELEDAMYGGSIGDGTRRSWYGFFSGQGNRRLGNLPDSPIGRIAAAVRGERRPKGIDIISRAGTITYEPIAGGAPGR